MQVAVARAGRRTTGGPIAASLPWWPDPGVVRRALAALLATLLALGAVPLVQQAVDGPPRPVDAVDSLDDLAPADRAAIEAQIAAARYHFVPTSDAWPDLGSAHVVGNPAAGIDAAVTADLLRVNATGRRDAAVDLRVSGFGRTDGPLAAVPAAAPPSGTDQTLSIDRRALVEWYRNDGRGLEQGFTVRERPLGAGALVLDLAVTGGTVALDGPDDARLVPAAGGSPITYAGLTVVDAAGRELDAAFEITAGGLRIVAHDADATYPVVIDPLLGTTQQLGPLPNMTDDAMGRSVDVEQRWMVVGAPGDRYDTGDRDGAVYLYFDSNGGGTWTLVGILRAPGLRPGLGGAVGTAVALDVEPDGLTIAATAPSAGLDGRGRVVVWQLAGDPQLAATGTSTPSQEVLAAPAMAGVSIIGYGASVDVQSGILAVGSVRGGYADRREPDGPDAGSDPDSYEERIGFVDLWERTGAALGDPFTHASRLHPPGGLDQTDPTLRDARQEFGASVALDDTWTLVVGAPGDDGVLTPTAGSVATPAPAGTTTSEGAVHNYVFDVDNGVWQHDGRFTAPTPTAGGRFGASVAQWVSTVLVGEPEGASSPRGGRAHLFSVGGGTAEHLFELDGEDPATPGADGRPGGQFGSSVAISNGGQRMAVGSIDRIAGGARTGTVTVYERDPFAFPPDAPEVVATLTPDDPLGVFSQFGVSVSIGGLVDTVAVGAPVYSSLTASQGHGLSFPPGGYGARAGRAYAFGDQGAGYEPLLVADPQVDEHWPTDFGRAVAQDGDVLVVTAPRDRRTTLDGAAYVFHREDEGWVLERAITPSGAHDVRASGSGWGESVAVRVLRDGDGEDVGAVIAIGAPRSDFIDPDGAGSLPRQVVEAGAGTVGIYFRNGPPGTEFRATSWLWSGSDTTGSPGDEGLTTTDGHFGAAVAFTGDGTLIVGEPGHWPAEEDPATHRGALLRYEPVGPGQYDYAGVVHVSSATDRYGEAVAADGTRVAAVGRGDAGVSSVLVLEDTGDDAPVVPRDEHGLGPNSDPDPDVDVAGDRIAVGQPGRNRALVLRDGPGPDDLTVEAELHGGSEGFGASVALAHDGPDLVLAVGEPGSDVAAGDAGEVHTYEGVPDDDGDVTWEAADRVLAPGTNATAGFGTDLALWPEASGLTAGAPGLDRASSDAHDVGGAFTVGVGYRRQLLDPPDGGGLLWSARGTEFVIDVDGPATPGGEVVGLRSYSHLADGSAPVGGHDHAVDLFRRVGTSWLWIGRDDRLRGATVLEGATLLTVAGPEALQRWVPAGLGFEPDGPPVTVDLGGQARLLVPNDGPWKPLVLPDGQVAMAADSTVAPTGGPDRLVVLQQGPTSFGVVTVLTDPEPNPARRFATAYAATDVLAIGTTFSDGLDPDPDQRRIYLARFEGGTWSISQTLTSPGQPTFGDRLAFAPNGDLVASSSPAMGSASGITHVWRDAGAEFLRRADLGSPTPPAGADTGASMASLGDVFAVGNAYARVPAAQAVNRGYPTVDLFRFGEDRRELLGTLAFPRSGQGGATPNNGLASVAVDVAAGQGTIFVGSTFANSGGETAEVWAWTEIGRAPSPRPPTSAFVDVTTPSLVPAGATAVPTAALAPTVLTDGEEDPGAIAAAPLSSIDLTRGPAAGHVAASPLSSIPLSSIPLSSIPLSSIPLSSIPLSSIDLTWDQLLAGSEWADVPLQSVTFAQALTLPQVQALQLGALDLAASPLSSIPLSSIALGPLPLSSIPLDQDEPALVTWCRVLDEHGVDPEAIGLDCEDHDDPANDDVTLMAVAMAGVPLSSIPLSSIPLSSIPLSSIPLSSIPLSSIPLSSIDVQGSPLSSIPLSSIPLSSIPLSSIPLSSIPLSSIPLSSIPLSSIPLSSIPLSSIPLSSIDVQASPLSSIPLSSIPLSSIPLSSIPLSSIPLSSIPLSSIPLSSIPLSSIPLSSIDLAATPLSSIPLSSIPLSSIPLSSIPLSSIPLSSIPLSSIPLSSIEIGGTPLSSIPLSSIAHPNTGAIKSLPLSSIPLSSIPLSSIGDVVDCDRFDCTRTGVTLGDAARAKALKSGATFGDLGPALSGVRLGDIAFLLDGVTPEDLREALAGLTLEDFEGFDDLTLGELPALHALLQLGDLVGALSGIRLGDLVGHLSGLTEGELVEMLRDLTLADVADWDDLTLGELPVLFALLTLGDLGDALGQVRLGDLIDVIVDEAGGRYDEDDLRAALESFFGTDGELGDLLQHGNLGDLTLGELGVYGLTNLAELLAAIQEHDPSALDGITLGDLLLALLSQSQYPWEALDYDRVLAQALDGADGGIAVQVAFQIMSFAAGGPVRVEVRPPFGSSFVPGSATLDPPSGDPGTSLAALAATASPLDPEVVDGALVWRFDHLQARVPHTLSFQLEPTLRIGTDQVKATVLAPDQDATAQDVANLTVVEAQEPNDLLQYATPLLDDTIHLSHISTPDDLDVYRFEATQGSRVSISLSNLDADLDAVLYSPLASSTGIGGDSGRRLDAVYDADTSVIPREDVDPEPADDLSEPLDLGDLAVNQASIRRGTADERIDTGVLQRSGTYYLVVSGYNGATNRDPYALRMRRLPGLALPPCPARAVPSATVTGSLPGTLPPGTDTVFLFNRSRLAGLHGAAAAQQVADALSALVSYVNAPAQDALGITAAVLPVDADPQVRAAYAEWDANPCLVEGANGVVAEVTRVLNGYRDAGADLRHVVVVGGDDVIPAARVPDRTKIANEASYAGTFPAGNALFATFATSHVLTDDGYVDRYADRLDDRALFVPEVAVGRLVETPAEIADQLGDFVAAGGRLATDTGLVTGYDFLVDGAEAVEGHLDATVTGELRRLISETWTREDLEDAIEALDPDLASINAHFDHQRALPGLGNSTHDESDLFTAAAVRGALAEDLAAAVVFSMGCHGGLSPSDLLAGDELGLDFAQAISSQGGVFVGNTGYGYGDTEANALSERLMTLFAQRLDGALTVGEALLYAKAEYAADLTAYGVYDEKALMESTLYGLPFYRLDVPNPPAPPPLPPAAAVSTDPVSGLPTASVTLTPDHVQRTTAEGGTFWVTIDPRTGEERTTVLPGRPVQPRDDTSFTAPEGLVARDALVVGMVTTDHAPVRPHIGQPIVDSSAERLDGATAVSFPATPLRVNPHLVPGGQAFTLSATTGHFRTTNTDGTGTQRLIDRLDAAPYFTSADDPDHVRPTFRQVDATMVDGLLSLAVRVEDAGDLDNVRRVHVLAVGEPEPGATTTWQAVDLVRSAGTDRWTGSVPLVADEDVEYLVQAVDGSGNVAITTNKARNYRDRQLQPPPPSGDLTVTPSGPEGEDGWYTGPVTIEVEGGTGLTYEVVGTTGEQVYEGPFTLTTDGPHLVVIRSAAGAVHQLVVRIDTIGPRPIVHGPEEGRVYSQGSGIQAVGFCLDGGSRETSCTVTLDGEPLEPGTDVTAEPGPHTVVVTAGPDQAGNAADPATASVTFHVVGPPDVTGVQLPDGVPQAGQPVTVTATYTADPQGAPHRAIVTWDDGSATDCTSDAPQPACTITEPDGSGVGTVTATHTYSSVAQRAVTVTVANRFGGADAQTVTLNRTTAITATPIVLRLKLLGGIVIETGSISARLTDTGGDPLAGQQIVFSAANGQVLCTATTGADGRAACGKLTFTLAALLGGHYRASFLGGGGYQGISTTAPLVQLG